jgi:hypothetical protein
MGILEVFSQRFFVFGPRRHGVLMFGTKGQRRYARVAITCFLMTDLDMGTLSWSEVMYRHCASRETTTWENARGGSWRFGGSHAECAEADGREILAY